MDGWDCSHLASRLFGAVGEERGGCSHATPLPSRADHDAPALSSLPRQVKERMYSQARLQAEALAEGKAAEEVDPVQV